MRIDFEKYRKHSDPKIVFNFNKDLLLGSIYGQQSDQRISYLYKILSKYLVALHTHVVNRINVTDVAEIISMYCLPHGCGAIKCSQYNKHMMCLVSVYPLEIKPAYKQSKINEKCILSMYDIKRDVVDEVKEMKMDVLLLHMLVEKDLGPMYHFRMLDERGVCVNNLFRRGTSITKYGSYSPNGLPKIIDSIGLKNVTKQDILDICAKYGVRQDSRAYKRLYG